MSRHPPGAPPLPFPGACSSNLAADIIHLETPQPIWAKQRPGYRSSPLTVTLFEQHPTLTPIIPDVWAGQASFWTLLGLLLDLPPSYQFSRTGSEVGVCFPAGANVPKKPLIHHATHQSPKERRHSVFDVTACWGMRAFRASFAVQVDCFPLSCALRMRYD